MFESGPRLAEWVGRDPLDAAVGPGAERVDPLEGIWQGLVAQLVDELATPAATDPCSPIDSDLDPAPARGPGEWLIGDALAAWCAARPPSAEVVTALTSLQRERLSPAGRIDAMVAWERVTAWSQAQGLQPLVDQVGASEVSRDCPNNREQVSALLEQSSRSDDAQVALRLSDFAMGHRLLVARQLTQRLSTTHRALATGRITWWHAVALAESLQLVDDVTAELVETSVVPVAERSTLATTRRAIQRALAKHDALGSAERHDAGKQVSDVVSWPERDGLAVLQVRGTALEVAKLQRLVDGAAAAEPDDDRPVGRRRVEALVRLACGPAADSAGGELRPQLQVQLVVDLPTLVGLADEPAVLPGYGAIPAAIAREWAADATSWRRLVVDPVTGALLDYGRTRYRPPPGLAQFVRARDRHCRFPGCRRPAARCDLDHRVAYASGGRTSADALHCLCRYHHRLKTFTDWVVRRRADGCDEWRSPTGRRIVVAPHHQLLD